MTEESLFAGPAIRRLRKREGLTQAAAAKRLDISPSYLNLIERINRELGGDFDASAFRHEARYNQKQGRIEMHLVSRREQTAQASGHSFRFRKGESIHTENSYKYHAEEFQALAAGQGFRPVRTWIDDKNLFSIHYLTRD